MGTCWRLSRNPEALERRLQLLPLAFSSTLRLPKEQQTEEKKLNLRLGFRGAGVPGRGKDTAHAPCQVLVAQSARFSQDGERCQSLSSLRTILFFLPLPNHGMMMLPKCRSSPDLQGVPPAFSGVWQRKLHSHLHLLYPSAGWRSCGSLGTNQTHSGLRSFSQKVEYSTDACPAQGLFPFSKHSLLILAAQSCPLSPPTIIGFFSCMSEHLP